MDERNARRKEAGKIKKKKKKKKGKKKKRQPKPQPRREMPQKGGKSEHEKTKKHEVVDMTQMEPRSKRQSTAEATARSAERNQNDKVRRGIAENSNKRRALTASMDEAEIPMSDIFGEDQKKPWKQHPKYRQLEEKAAAYVDKLPYSQSKGGGGTMHRN